MTYTSEKDSLSVEEQEDGTFSVSWDENDPRYSFLNDMTNEEINDFFNRAIEDFLMEFNNDESVQ